MSTDQLVYYNSMHKDRINYQFLLLVELGSLNCFDYKNISLSKINKLLNINNEINDSQNPCFSCNATGKQLFNARDIYKDLETNNCEKPDLNLN